MQYHPNIKLENNAFELTDKSTIEIKGKITNYFGEEIKGKKFTINEAKLLNSK